MGNLLDSYSAIHELRYVNECKLNNPIKISDNEAIENLKLEFNS